MSPQERATTARNQTLTSGLLDDPDCLAELEHTYSVFRFRYTWGTVYELTFSPLADAEDRKACMVLMPKAVAHLDTFASDTLCFDEAGEVTHRFVA